MNWSPYRIEWVQARGLRVFIETARRLKVMTPHDALDVAGGVAAFFGAGNPVSVLRGAAINEPLGDADFAQVLEFYRERGDVLRFETNPDSHPSLQARVNDAAVTHIRTDHVCARAVRAADAALRPQGEVVEVDAALEADYCDVVGRGFNDGQPALPAFRDHGPVNCAIDNGRNFLVRIEGRFAGGGRAGVYDIPAERGGGRIALFAGGSTLPEFRRRGVQLAVLTARLAYAARVGCDTAAVVCGPGTGSHRNIVRAGFSTAYPRADWRFG
jgi:hypothetical protein